MAGRRDNGAGSICKRGDGRWTAKIQIGFSDNGKPKMKYFYGKSEAEVKRKLKEYTRQRIANNYVEVKKETVQNYMDNWLYNVKALKLKPSSLDKNEFILKNCIYTEIGQIQFGSLCSNDIQQLISNMISHGYSYSMISQTYHLLRGCFTLAIQKRELIFNPTDGVVLPEKEHSTKDNMKFFTDAELNDISQIATLRYKNGNRRFRLGWAIPLLAHTGMRVGELCALKWEDVNWDEKTIHVTKTMSKVKNRSDTAGNGHMQMLIITRPKTPKSVRAIPLSNLAFKALEELREETGMFEYIICKANGENMIPSSVNLFFNKMLKEASLEQRGVHSLRHTFASLLYKSNVQSRTVSELIGHSNTSITENTYIHLVNKQKEEAIHLLDKDTDV